MVKLIYFTINHTILIMSLIDFMSNTLLYMTYVHSINEVTDGASFVRILNLSSVRIISTVTR